MVEVALDQALDEARTRKALPAPRARRMLRELSGMSQADIAHVVGVSEATISRWESGLRHPRRPAMSRYAAVLQRLAQEVNAEPAGSATPRARPARSIETVTT